MAEIKDLEGQLRDTTEQLRNEKACSLFHLEAKLKLMDEVTSLKKTLEKFMEEEY